VLLALRVAGHSYLGSAIAPLLLDGLTFCTVLMPVTALAMRTSPPSGPDPPQDYSRPPSSGDNSAQSSVYIVTSQLVAFINGDGAAA
jgi:hypothetical protein